MSEPERRLSAGPAAPAAAGGSILAQAGIQPPARLPRLSAAQRSALLHVCALRYPAGYVPAWQSLWWLYERGYIARLDGQDYTACPAWQRSRVVADVMRPTDAGRALAVAILTAERLCSALVPCEPPAAGAAGPAESRRSDGPAESRRSDGPAESRRSGALAGQPAGEPVQAGRGADD